jgi:hypothetical protein
LAPSATIHALIINHEVQGRALRPACTSGRQRERRAMIQIAWTIPGM